MTAISNFFNALIWRFLPNPFVIAVFLLIIIIFSAITITSTPLETIVIAFNDGFWSLLAFTMQLSIVLITSAVIANSPIFRKPFKWLASLPKTPLQATFTVAFITSVVGLINWGVALVVGIIYAKEVARQVKGTHYPLLIAASYIGFTIWSSGLSSSIPLILNTLGNPLEDIVGIIPLTETIFTRYNLIITLSLLFTYAFISRFMMPKSGKIIETPKAISNTDDTHQSTNDSHHSTQEPSLASLNSSPAEKLEKSRIISTTAALFALISFVYTMGTKGIDALNLNSINMLTIGIGLLLYPGVKGYLEAATASVKSVAPLIILYPFYGAAQTIIGSSGLGEELTLLFANIATKETLPLVTYLSAGVLNLFVPAAGGQIIMQGPIFLPLAKELAVPEGLVAMAITYGDTWTNLLQPFWALPALGLAGLGVRDIMGYCVIALIVSGFVTGLLLTVLPLIF